MKRLLTYMQGDRPIWIVVILFAILSTVSVYSAAGSLAFRHRGGNAEYYLLNRFLMVLLGLACMFVAHRTPYTWFSNISVFGMVVTIPLLVITLVMGANVNEAARWLPIPGLSQTFQTSDVAKLFLLLYIARVLAKRQKVIKDFKQGFLPVAIPTVLVCALILPANFSTSALLFLTATLLMFVGGISLKHLGKLYGTAIAGFALLVGISFAAPNILPRLETWKNRIENFYEEKPEDTYQVEQAKMSIAQGRFQGAGPGNNISKYRLPQSYSDFIYAFMIGELGIVIGGLSVLLGFLIIMYRVVRIATKTDKAFATFAALGLGMSLVIQAFINMCVAVNLIPVTGQPLPFISMGGTSTLFSGLQIGIILSISRSIQSQAEEGPEDE